MRDPTRIREIFDRVLELPSAERQAYLDDACAGDAELQREILELLHAAGESEGFLEQLHPMAEAALAEVADLAPSSDQVGPYRILREVGRGGMGMVFLAERSDGQFRHRVALKLIKRGMDSDAILRGFLRERQILARLQHEGIARLLDGGIDADGRPYFAMEYVEGEPITDYSEDQDLGIRDRLKLFQQICAAMQFAHANLVVHRDLKPSNILVSAAGVVKLLDFGIAKLLDAETPEGTITRSGLSPMTPEYAAPELVRGAPIGTAADIYALGIILYELLCGQQPYKLDSQNRHEIERTLETTQISPPSRVLRSSPQRGGQERRVRGDLDTIVLKAMHRDAAQRYGSVEALHDDIQRYLDGLPVRARRDTLAYRASKFVRRNAALVAATVTLIALLSAFTLVATWQRAVAERQRDRAEAVRDFVVGLFEGSNPLLGGSGDVTARQLLESGSERIARDLSDQLALQGELWTVIGKAYHELGDYEQAALELERSVQALREAGADGKLLLAASLYELGDTHRRLNRLDAAEACFQESWSLRSQNLDAGHHLVGQSLLGLGLSARSRGDLDAAETHYRQGLAILRASYPEGGRELAVGLNNLAVLLNIRGDFAGAVPVFEESIEVYARLHGPEHPDIARALSSLSVSHRGNRDLESAVEVGRRSLAMRERLLGPDHPDVAYSAHNLAATLSQLGEYEEALAHSQSSLELRGAQMGAEHPLTILSRQMTANILGWMGRLDESLRLRELTLQQQRAALEPSQPELWMALNEMGEALARVGRIEEAERIYRESWGAWQAHSADPERKWSPFQRTIAANAAAGLGRVHLRRGEFARAEVLLRSSDALMQDAVGASHFWSAHSRALLGHCLSEAGEAAAADSLLREAGEFLLQDNARSYEAGEARDWLVAHCRRQGDEAGAREFERRFDSK